MKKLYFLLSTTAALLSISFSAYAGQWQQEGEHWKYLNNDGTYSAHTWQWIDGNGDGISESYYFDDNGFLYLDTITPDGYSVNQCARPTFLAKILNIFGKIFWENGSLK